MAQVAISNVSPVVQGIVKELDDPTNPGTLATALDYLAAFDAGVDGKYASTSEEVRLLVSPACWRQAMALQLPTSGQLVRDVIPASRFRASANLTPVSATVATAIAYSAGVPARGFHRADVGGRSNRG